MRLIDAEAWKLELLMLHGTNEKTAWIINRINHAPTIDAVPVVHGKWIYSNDFHWYTASCNKCGYQRRTDIKADGWNQWKFCPNCGARMDAERREE